MPYPCIIWYNSFRKNDGTPFVASLSTMACPWTFVRIPLHAIKTPKHMPRNPRSLDFLKSLCKSFLVGLQRYFGPNWMTESPARLSRCSLWNLYILVNGSSEGFVRKHTRKLLTAVISAYCENPSLPIALRFWVK